MPISVSSTEHLPSAQLCISILCTKACRYCFIDRSRGDIPGFTLLLFVTARLVQFQSRGIWSFLGCVAFVSTMISIGLELHNDFEVINSFSSLHWFESKRGDYIGRTELLIPLLVDIF